ncbi:YybH family protein [Sulfurivermis fontis]|jgi:ketosteroid isomerase-like protein|uniref:YybH family protein n=1 Tax=Sulfurivermis fontis TaxID=1972068 RepID=UPI000FD9C496|nr:nuclear transport factor 2 family protein [Sulfurivermis fontis]
MNNDPRLAGAPDRVTTVDATAEVTALIRRWEGAIQADDRAGILVHHTEDIVMFDVPEPLQSLGLAAYHKTWDLFFRYGTPHPELFVIEELRVTAGSDVAFATGLLRIGGSPSPVCRLTLGLVKRDGQWLIAHEHHSAPHALEAEEPRS